MLGSARGATNLCVIVFVMSVAAAHEPQYPPASGLKLEETGLEAARRRRRVRGRR